MYSPMRGITPLRAYDPVEPIAPYGQFPYRQQHTVLTGYDRLAHARWLRALRKTAEDIRDRLEELREAREATQQFLNGTPAAWHARTVSSSDPEAVLGEARAGLERQTIAVEVQQIATAQRQVGFELARHGAALLAPGEHQLMLRSADNQHKHTVSLRIEAADTNAQLLGKLTQAINGARAGVQARLLEDRAAGTLQLEVSGEQTGADSAFVLEDKFGNAAAATGINMPGQPAVNAIFRIVPVTGKQMHDSRAQHWDMSNVADRHNTVSHSEEQGLDGGWQEAGSNIIELAEGRLKLHLLRTTREPVQLRVEPNADVILLPIKGLLNRINALQEKLQQPMPELHPQWLQELEAAMDGAEAARSGIVRDSAGMWQLYEETLRRAIADMPDQTRRDLSGADGWAGKLCRILTRLEQIPAFDWMHPGLEELQAYSQYHATMQTYWYMPFSGWMINSRW